jgi:hypothetical protein
MNSKKWLVVPLIFCLGACMVPQLVTTYQTRNDVVLKNTWTDFLVNNPHPKVVLRVPDAPKDITQSEMMSYNSLYNFIEKRLLEANFTVRDRSLLREVLNRAGGELNYADIGKKIDTDIIVEIVNVRLGTWMLGTSSSEYQGYRSYAASAAQAIQKGGVGTAAGPTQADVFGAILEGRVIMVSTGDVVGMFTLKELHPHPESWLTYANGQIIRIKSEDLSEADIEYLRTNITQKLMNFLKGQAVPDSVASWSRAPRP